jgi:hypothetical protein
MDPFTFGMVAVGVSGGSVLLLTLLEKYGLKMNETMVTMILEISKAGIFLYALKHISKLFW